MIQIQLQIEEQGDGVAFMLTEFEQAPCQCSNPHCERKHGATQIEKTVSRMMLASISAIIEHDADRFVSKIGFVNKQVSPLLDKLGALDEAGTLTPETAVELANEFLRSLPEDSPIANVEIVPMTGLESIEDAARMIADKIMDKLDEEDAFEETAMPFDPKISA